MLMRSPESRELLHDLLAFGLLGLIAFRACWRATFSADGLQIGEALIGDYKNCGMTRRQYRTRVARLEKWGFIETRTTCKGTIAKLRSNAVFDINSSQGARLSGADPATNGPPERPTTSPVENGSGRPTERPTDDQQTANTRPVTKKETMKECVVVAPADNDSTSVDAERLRQLRRIAADSDTDEELMANLGQALPRVDVQWHWDDYISYCKRKNRRQSREGLLRRLAKAQPELQPTQKKRAAEAKERYENQRRASERRGDIENEASVVRS
jgi:hypothetical protein